MDLYSQLHFPSETSDLAYIEIMEACRPFYALDAKPTTHNLAPRLEDGLLKVGSGA